MAGRKINWRICVRATGEEYDAKGRATLSELHHTGFTEITSVRTTRIYELCGSLSREQIQVLCDRLLVDPAIEFGSIESVIDWPDSNTAQVEVHCQPGVMDPVALSAIDAANDLLYANDPTVNKPVESIQTAWQYEIAGVDCIDRIEAMAESVLANDCVERVFIKALDRCDALPTEFAIAPVADFNLLTVDLAGKDEDALIRISKQGRLFLNALEMKAIQQHYHLLDRNPTDIELETIAQTWSEHCVHKTLKSAVQYRGRPFGNESRESIECERSYDNLLVDTIVKATRDLDCDWCLSVFEDNAGVVAFDDDNGIAFKVETHNHPSAIEPYGGAATGVGGCVRDILGCGLGAKPIANTDVFCVAEPGWDSARLPAGVLHPRRILRGIIGGVRDYGNRMGIPTVAGGLRFDERYLTNPLVFVGSVGIIPRKHIAKAPKPGDRIVVAGGRTGRDGIGGATFSSGELTDTHADEFAHAVQIGNAIEEKKVLDALLRARDHESGCLYSAVTDCGAGGLSSAVGEMAEHLGATVQLENVPLKYSGLRYNEIWLSEAQERMVFSVPPDKLETLRAVFEREGVEVADIGEFNDSGTLELHFNDEQVGRLDLDFMHNGIPPLTRAAIWNGPPENIAPANPTSITPQNAEEIMLAKLASIDSCSREPIFRQYDFEVQGGSVIKPLVGVGEGPSDAAVITPRLDSNRGVAIGMGMCSDRVEPDPYWMAIRSIDEAIRNLVCVGADPSRIAILDNFCWGGCADEEAMGALVRACQGCHDAALAYKTPFISGKDSLNNQFSLSPDDAARLKLPKTIAIPPTLLISGIGHVEDVRRCVTSDLKREEGHFVAVVFDWDSPDLERFAKIHAAIADLIRQGDVLACHDFGDEGIACALAEMCIGGKVGADLFLQDICKDTMAHLFGEHHTGYVLQTRTSAESDPILDLTWSLDLWGGLDENRFRLDNRVLDGILFDVQLTDLDRAWRSGLARDLGERADG
ncbi:MAG: phosphoribosylformylglycinamidine synthase subunit PurL [Phycisphaerae bacterium]|nr:MAG: phosphoribosylformylglycinamidine synthase subunit PurL [Phycisphaerae bacterium]